MTDAELVELALRRTLAKMGGTPLGYWLNDLAEELEKINSDIRKNKETPQ